MGRKKSSHRWLREHFEDEFVKRARREGWRSRAVYKLIEIDERDRLFRPGMAVVDLGAAPGGWSQYAIKRIGERGNLVALDILPFDPIAGVTSLTGDFRDEEVFRQLLERLDGREVDLVLSDMAPNISGVREVDQTKSSYLSELAVDFSDRAVKQGGSLLIKLFHGEGFDQIIRSLRERFSEVRTRKPKASRDRSREVYALAQNRR
jgi:23S rRNA (uridine2552-2'-O)-methyltransferase